MRFKIFKRNDFEYHQSGITKVINLQIFSQVKADQQKVDVNKNLVTFDTLFLSLLSILLLTKQLTNSHFVYEYQVKEELK